MLHLKSVLKLWSPCPEKHLLKRQLHLEGDDPPFLRALQRAVPLHPFEISWEFCYKSFSVKHQIVAVLVGGCKRQLSLLCPLTKGSYSKTDPVDCLIKYLPYVAVSCLTNMPCVVLSTVYISESSCFSFHLTWYWFTILAGFSDLLSGIGTWARCLLAASAIWVPFSFIPLIVEQFCIIDKLQVWYSEGGKGQLRVNGGALGYDTHLDSSIRQSCVVKGMFMGLVINHKTG